MCIEEKRTIFRKCYKEDNSKANKYIKEINFLKQHHYLFPYEMISLYGLKKLFEELKNMLEKGSSKNIPSLLKEAFHFEHKYLHKEDLTTKETVFDNIKEYRHKIAHGSKKINLTIPEVTKMNRQLREIAVAFDKHLVEHFFINQRFIK